MVKNGAWQNIFSPSERGIVIVCSTASGGLFSGKLVRHLCWQMQLLQGKTLWLWTKMKTSEELLLLPSITILSSSITQTAAGRINGNSSTIHWEFCARASLDGNLDFSINEEELAVVRVPSGSLHTRSWASSWQVVYNEGAMTPALI